MNPFTNPTISDATRAKINDVLRSASVPVPEPEPGPGMVACEVEYHYSAWLVTFADGRTLLLQSDYDQACFAVDCGVLAAPEEWNGQPSNLEGWADLDVSDIWRCPDSYLDVAEESEGV